MILHENFQRLTDQVTTNLEFVCACSDDTLVISESEEDHNDHPRQLFELLANYTMSIIAAEILDSTVTLQCIALLEDRIQTACFFRFPVHDLHFFI